MIATQDKLLIGACGGVCLSLIKLIEANFYLASSPTVIAGAYLTYAAYIGLGMFVGYFFSEEHKDDLPKTRKSVFTMGLLAPSIIVALVSRPIQVPSAVGANASSIQELGRNVIDLVAPRAFAQPTRVSVTGDTTTQILRREDLSGGFQAGMKSALGRPLASERMLVVIGKASSEEAARRAARDFGAILVPDSLRASVMRVEGGTDYFVVVGGLVTLDHAAALKQAVRQAAIDALGTNLSVQQRKTASALAATDIFRGSSFFTAR
jgi:hypothetical protein